MKPHDRLAIAHVDGELGRFRQRLLHQRRDAGSQRNRVALAVLEALDAKLALLRRERGLVLPGDSDERREIDAFARQVLGELEAYARRRGVRIDRVVEQPEAVVLAHPLVLLAHLRDFAQVERNAQRIERRTPHRAIGIAARNHHQAVGFLARIAGAALIGDVGGRRRALEQQGALAIVARTDLQHGFRQSQPVRAVVGRDHHDLPEQLQAAAEVVALEGRVRFPPQRRGGLGDLAGLGLDLRFELDRRVGQIVALEGLVGGNGGNGQQQYDRGGKNTAGKREHGETSGAQGWGKSVRACQHDRAKMSRS